ALLSFPTRRSSDLLVADGLGERLAQGDADILDGVVVVDVHVALALDVQIDQPVAGDLVEHVLEEGHADGEVRLAGAIEIDRRLDAGFQGVAFDERLTFDHDQLRKRTEGAVDVFHSPKGAHYRPEPARRGTARPVGTRRAACYP